MIQGKQDSANLCLSNSSNLVESTASSSSSSSSSIGGAPLLTDAILQNLFQARTDSAAPLQRRRPRTTNEQRASPLQSLPRTTLFSTCQSPALSAGSDKQTTTEWNPSSLLRELEQQYFIRNASSVVKKEAAPISSSGGSPFPLFPSLFPTASTPNGASSTPTESDQDDLQRVRSFATSFITSHQTRTINRNNSKGRRVVRNQASRHRIVGQVLGHKRVFRVVALVHEIRRVQQRQQQDAMANSTPKALQDILSNTVLVDAWETTPLNDLKSLPWEDMLSTAEKHMDAYCAWQRSSSKAPSTPDA